MDVKDVRDTTRHTGSKVASSRAKNKDTTTSHVLATVVTNTLDDCRSTRVTDTEALSSDTAEEAGTASGTIQADVANEDVLLGTVYGVAGRVDDQTTTRETLANVVVSVTLKFKCDTRCQVSTERLASRTTDVDVNGVLRQTSLAVALADVVREGSTKSTVGVDDIALNAGRETLLKSKFRLSNELVVETDVETVVLLADVE
jgi:hypothetical protein